MHYFYILLLFSYSFASISWTIKTNLSTEIKNVSLLSIKSDSIEIESDIANYNIAINDIDEVLLNRPIARMVSTGIGGVFGGLTGSIIGIRTHKEFKDIYSFTNNYIKRSLLGGTIGSITFGYLVYKIFDDKVYEFKELSEDEKLKMLNKIHNPIISK